MPSVTMDRLMSLERKYIFERLVSVPLLGSYQSVSSATSKTLSRYQQFVSRGEDSSRNRDVGRWQFELRLAASIP